MSAKLIDGTAVAATIREEIAIEVAAMVAAGSTPPGLGVLLVGDDPASAIYVRMKTTACQQAGFYSEQLILPADATQDDVVAAVRGFNEDPRIHGILVQLPLPGHVDEDLVVRTIDPAKDADGLHPDNVARLAMGLPRVLPCTPAGVMELLRHEQTELRGIEAVVVGRSNLVGRPVARLLQLADATVTVAHSRTADLGAVTRRAGVLVVAAGHPGLVTGAMVRPGATVIDVGVNALPAQQEGGKRQVVGDCDRESVAAVAGKLSPVPGGVGPMTIAMLLSNTLQAARR
ncbi:MAG TPA: bifunctional 5,10-methylenetetrahydrofolate dehydrogenase/5,10-methenyltetrahydrofolate cyclohydrolase [Candidatus Dormibacteraeota bacterium]|nr:bifunctional 5,10-methylenetetrahydrofolate dehydrogenase/5,10-methenyltetrahydrofolate cyclohydrolase [Candidatus Dormibacteraeota bacterium]